MGISVQQYRATVGHFNCVCSMYKYSSASSFWSVLGELLFKHVCKHLMCAVALSLWTFLLGNVYFLLIMKILLQLCCDVESNPGPRNVEILHVNINSIWPKFDIIESGIFKADILCFTESKLDPTILDNDISLHEYYKPIRNDRNRHGGGIIIYVKTYLHYELITLPDALASRCESLWLKISMNNKHFILGCVYRQPALPVGWWTTLSEVFDLIFDHYPNKDFIIVGDFNEDLLNPNLRHLREVIVNSGCVQLVDKPTRITPSSETLLDPIITNNANLIQNWNVLDNLLSDHCIITMTLTYKPNNDQSYQRLIWNYDDGDYDGLRQHLSLVRWDEMLGNEVDLETMCTNFISTINEATKNFIPTKIVTIRPRDKPWMTAEVRSLMRVRLKAYRKARAKVNDPEMWAKYNRLRNEVINKIRLAKQVFLDKKSEKIKTTQFNNKDWWKLVSEITNLKNVRKSIPALKSNTNPMTVYNDSASKANELNKYFVSISTINDDGLAIPPVTKRTDNQVHVISTSSREILGILKTLQTNKATGPDGVNNKILLETASVISEPLSYMFNRLLNEGYFPDCWKQVHVTAIPKAGLSNSTKDYRPISITSNVGKILERVVFNHLIDFLQTNDLLFKYQAGFLAGHSTETQLIEIYHNICLAIEEKKGVQFVFCDYSKAFDKVWHRGLIQKLVAHGVDGTLLNWFKSYLTNRQQCVVLDAAKSDFLCPNAGVPQGSVLGPLLFLIYINDIQDIINTNLRQFADDASAFLLYRHFNEVTHFLVPDLESLLQWSNDWLMSFNPDKTEGLNICLINQQREAILLDEKEITDVTTHKHLGLLFNNSATWSDQINGMHGKASSKLKILRSFKYKFDRKTLEVLYFSFVRSGLEYASTVWDSCTQHEAQLLENIQSEAARICTGLPKYCSLERLYGEIGWVPLETRRKIKKLITMYKIKNNLAPAYLRDLLPETVGETQNYQLRNNRDLKNYRTRTSIFANSFFPSTIMLWNKTDYEIRSSPTLAQFISKIKKKFKADQPPIWFTHGERYLNVLHCRLRNHCSTLNSHLFRCNLVTDSNCLCGHPNETTEHFFLHCPNFVIQRDALLNFFHMKDYPVDLDLILQGSNFLTSIENFEIFDNVQRFIKDTRRFTQT